MDIPWSQASSGASPSLARIDSHIPSAVWRHGPSDEEDVAVPGSPAAAGAAGAAGAAAAAALAPAPVVPAVIVPVIGPQAVQPTLKVSEHFAELSKDPSGLLDTVSANVFTDKLTTALLRPADSVAGGSGPAEHAVSHSTRTELAEYAADLEASLGAGVLDTTARKDHTLLRLVQDLVASLTDVPAYHHTLYARTELFRHLQELVKAERRPANASKFQPRCVFTGNDLQLQEIVLYALSSLVKTVQGMDAQDLEEPLTAFTGLLDEFQPGVFFADWSPHRVGPQSALVLPKSAFSASAAGHEAILEPTATLWVPTGVVKPRVDVTFEQPQLVSSVQITFAKDSLPRRIQIDMTMPGSSDWIEVCAVDTLTALDTSTPGSFVASVSVHCNTVSGLRISFDGQARGSSRLAVKHLQVMQPNPAALHTPLLKLVQDLQEWLISCAQHPALRARALQGCLWLAMASGSLSCLLRYANAALTLEDLPFEAIDPAHIDDDDDIPATAGALINGDERSTALRMLRALHKFREQAGPRVGGGPAGPQDIDARFLLSASTQSALAIEADGKRVRSTSSNAIAVLDCSFSDGFVSWECKLEEDSHGGECTCFGLVWLPLTTAQYQSANHLMYRCYNGELYGNNRTGSARRRIHPGDTVRCELDFAAGTLSYSVNGDSQGVCFTNIVGTVTPAVAFYSSGKAISIMDVRHIPAAAAAAAAAGPAAAAAATSGPVAAAAGAAGATTASASISSSMGSLFGSHALPTAAAPAAAGTADDDEEPNIEELRSRYPAMDDLAALGFELESCARALMASSGNVEAAADWLITNGDSEMDRLAAVRERRAARRRAREAAAREAAAREEAARAAAASGGAATEGAAADGADAAATAATEAADAAAAAPAEPAVAEPAPPPPDETGFYAKAHSRYEFVQLLLAELVELSDRYYVPAARRRPVASQAAVLDLEEKFCVEASVETLSLLVNLMDRGLAMAAAAMYDSPPTDGSIGSMTPVDKYLVCLLRLVKGSVGRLVAAQIQPGAVGLESPASLALLRQLVDNLWAVIDNPYHALVQKEAVDAVDSGLELLFPSAQQRADLLASLLRRHSEQPFEQASCLYTLTHSVMARFSTAAGCAFLLPPATGCFNDLEARELLQLQSRILHMLALETRRHLAGSTTAANQDSHLLVQGQRLLAVFQRQLWSMAADCRTATDAPAAVMRAYASMLFQHAQQVIADVAGAPHELLLAACQASVVGTLLPSFLMYCSVNAHVPWLAHAILRPGIQFTAAVDRLVSSIPSISAVDAALRKQYVAECIRKLAPPDDEDDGGNFTPEPDNLEMEVIEVDSNEQLRAAQVITERNSTRWAPSTINNVGVLMRHRAPGSFKLQSVQIRPGSRAIESVAIFVFKTRPALSALSAYDNMTSTALAAAVSTDPPSSSGTPRPVAFFTSVAPGGDGARIQLKEPVVGRYIALKIIGPSRGQTQWEIEYVIPRGHKHLAAGQELQLAGYAALGSRVEELSMTLSAPVASDSVSGTVVCASGTRYSVSGTLSATKLDVVLAPTNEGKDGEASDSKDSLAEGYRLTCLRPALEPRSGGTITRIVAGEEKPLLDTNMSNKFCLWQLDPSAAPVAALRIPWLLDLEKSSVAIFSKAACTLIRGPIVTQDEVEMSARLKSPLFSGGLDAGERISVPRALPGVAAVSSPTDGAPESKSPVPEVDSKTESDLLLNPTSRKLLEVVNALNLVVDGIPTSDLVWSTNSSAASAGRNAVAARRSQFFRRLLDAGVASKDSIARRLIDLIADKCDDKGIGSTRLRPVELPVALALMKHTGAWTEAESLVRSLEADEGMADITLSPIMQHVWRRVRAVRAACHTHETRYSSENGEDSKAPSAAAAAAAEAAPETDARTVRGRRRLRQQANKLLAPTTIKQYRRTLVARAKFLLDLVPCRLAPVSEDMVMSSQLAEKWTEMLPGPALQPLLQRWQSSEAMASGGNPWDRMYSVLRRQNSWDRSHTRQSMLYGHSSEMADNDNDGTADAEADEDMDEAISPSVSDTLRDVSAFIASGDDAAPELLFELLERRHLRAQYREYGLHALVALMDAVSHPTVHVDALLELRPALRGSEESLDDDGTPPVPWSLRHHYLQGLEGCAATDLDGVQAAFVILYSKLTTLLTEAAAVGDPCLGHTVMWCWGCDLEARDHELLLRLSLLPSLSKLMSITGLVPSEAELCNLPQPQDVNWTAPHPGCLTVVRTRSNEGVLLASAAPNDLGISAGDALLAVDDMDVSKAPADFVREALRERFQAAVAAEDAGHGTYAHTRLPTTDALVTVPPIVFKIRRAPKLTTRWRPVSIADIRAGFSAGQLTKRQLIRYMKLCPYGFVPDGWWAEHRLDGNITDAVARHSVASLIVAYEQFMYQEPEDEQQAAAAAAAAATPDLVGQILAKSTNVYMYVNSGICANAQPYMGADSVKVTSIPSRLVGLPYIRCADVDKINTDVDLLRFRVLRPVHVMIALHNRLPVPNWVTDSYRMTSLTMSCGGAVFSVFESREVFPAMSTVVLGGTGCRSTGPDGFGYIVMLREAHQPPRDDGPAPDSSLLDSVVPLLDTAGVSPPALFRRTSWALYRLLSTMVVTSVTDEPTGLGKESSTIAAMGVGQVALGQTLRYSLELQRVVFDLLEAELVLGTSVLKGTPSADLKNLEVMELESILYSQLLFVYSLCNTKPGLTHLGKPRVLRCLFGLLQVGSPRLQRVLMSLLRNIAPQSGSIGVCDALRESVAEAQYNTWVTASGSGHNAFVGMLLDMVARGVCASVNMDQKSADNLLMNSAEQGKDNPSNPVGVGSGYVQMARACEAVAVLRILLQSSEWVGAVSDALDTALCGLTAPLSRDLVAADFAAISAGAAALCVMGGQFETLRVGGRVAVVSAQGQSVGTLVTYSPEHAQARVTFGGLTSTLQTVEVSSLRPLDTVAMQPQSMLVTPSTCTVFQTILRVPEPSGKAAASVTGVWITQLKSLAISSLEGLLRHQQHARTAMQQGLLNDLYAIALQPATMPTFVSLVNLEKRRMFLQARLLELSAVGGFDLLAPATRNSRDRTPSVAESKSASDSKGAELDSKDSKTEDDAFMTSGDLAAMMPARLPSIVRISGGDPPSRLELAQSLSAAHKFPVALLVPVLGMLGDKPDDAVAWIAEKGAQYLKQLPAAVFTGAVEFKDVGTLQVRLKTEGSSSKSVKADMAVTAVTDLTGHDVRAGTATTSERATGGFDPKTRALRIGGPVLNQWRLGALQFDLELAADWSVLSGTVHAPTLAASAPVELRMDRNSFFGDALDDDAPLEGLPAAGGNASRGGGGGSSSSNSNSNSNSSFANSLIQDDRRTAVARSDQETKEAQQMAAEVAGASQVTLQALVGASSKSSDETVPSALRGNAVDVEFTLETAGSSLLAMGLCVQVDRLNTYLGNHEGYMLLNDGRRGHSGRWEAWAPVSSWESGRLPVGSKLRFVYDPSAGTITLFHNGTNMGVLFEGVGDVALFPAVSLSNENDTVRISSKNYSWAGCPKAEEQRWTTSADEFALTLATSASSGSSAIATKKLAVARAAGVVVDARYSQFTTMRAGNNAPSKVREAMKSAGFGSKEIEEFFSQTEAAAAAQDAQANGLDSKDVDSKTYLDTLPFTANSSQLATGVVGIRGQLGLNEGTRILVCGTPVEHAIGVIPQNNSSASVHFALDAGYELLHGSVGLSDTAGEAGAASEVSFEVLGDGVSLWKSKPIKEPRDFVRFHLNVYSVRSLQLSVSTKGDATNAHAVWNNVLLTGVGAASLRPGMMLAATMSTGDQQLCNVALGCLVSTPYFGSVAGVASRACVRLRFLDAERGLTSEQDVRLDGVRRVAKMYGVPVSGMSGVCRLMTDTHVSLSRHYARMALRSLFESWGSATSELGVSSRSGARRLVDLVKLVASSEGTFMRAEDSGADRTSRAAQSPVLASLRTVLRDCLAAEAGQQGNTSSSHGGILSAVLVDECVRNFVEATQPTDVVCQESLHPHPPRVSWRGSFEAPGAAGIRVFFDKECKMTGGAGDDGVIFYSSPSMTPESEIGRAGPKTWQALTLRCDQVWWQSVLSKNASNQWGFRFFASPISGRWVSEMQVLSSCSLEWACWVLEFLLSDAAAVVAKGAIHNRKLFDALVRYLRTRGTSVRLKPTVVSLLTQLLSTPSMFPADQAPDLAQMQGIEHAVMGATGPGGSTFLDPRLQQLVELVVIRRVAMRAFAEPTTTGVNAQMRYVPGKRDALARPTKLLTRDELDELCRVACARYSVGIETGVVNSFVASPVLDEAAFCGLWGGEGGPAMFRATTGGRDWMDVYDYLHLVASVRLDSTLEDVVRSAGTSATFPPNQLERPAADAAGAVEEVRILSPHSLAGVIGVTFISSTREMLELSGQLAVTPALAAQIGVGAAETKAAEAEADSKSADTLVDASLELGPNSVVDHIVCIAVPPTPSALRRLVEAAKTAGAAAVLLVGDWAGGVVEDLALPVAWTPAGGLRKILETAAAAGTAGKMSMGTLALASVAAAKWRRSKSSSGAPRPILARALSDDRAASEDGGFSEPIDLNADEEGSQPIDKLLQTRDLVTCLAKRQRFPTSVLRNAWMQSNALARVVETEHPYRPEQKLKGTLRFPGAARVFISFAPRCSTTGRLVLSGASSGEKVFTGVVTKPTEADARWHRGAKVIIDGDCVNYELQLAADDHNAKAEYGVCFVATPDGLSNEAKTSIWLQTAEEGVRVCKEVTLNWTEDQDTDLVDLVRARATKSADKTISVDSLFDEHPQEMMTYQHLAGVPWSHIRMRFAMLQAFNTAISEVIGSFDLYSDRPWTTGYRLRSMVHCVFNALKVRILDSAVAATAGRVQCKSIILDNFKASESLELQRTDIDTSKCIFVQAFEQLKGVPAEAFRCSSNGDRVFGVNFKGESGIDAGGVYREGLQRIMEDLFSKAVNLLLPCPNAVHKVGFNQGSFVPNPQLKSPLAMEMLEFVGRLMGLSLRFKSSLPFLFPSIIWKPLAGKVVTHEDLVAVDQLYGQFVYAIKDCDKEYTLDGLQHPPILNDADFEEAFGEATFVTNSASGEEVELIPGGRSTKVTFSNRHRFVRLVEEFRLHEFDDQVAAIRRGLGMTVPLPVLRLFTWQELEVLVAGRPEVDVELLKRHTTYEGYTAEDPVIKRFWAVFSTLSADERSKYVRFAWGRSRLPASDKWSNNHTLTRRGASDPDRTLPLSHTCFFSIELPPYTTEERMRWALLTVIHFGCGGILNG